MANTTVNIDIQVQSKSLAALESELEQINAELKDIPVGSKAFNDLAQKAQGVTKQLDKANEAIKGFTFDDKIRAADGAIKVLGGSLASTVGILGTLGVESEVFGEFEKKAASAIAVAVGFKDLSEGIQQLGPAFKSAGIAAKLFGNTTRAAIAATGIGLLVVALGTVVAYWDDITEALGSASKETEGLLKLQEDVVAESQAQLDLLNSQDNILKLQGLSEKEILNLKIAQTDEVIAQIQLQKKAAKEVADEQISNTSRVVAFLQANPILSALGGLFGYGYEDVGKLAQEGQAVQDELDKQINALTNQRAGYQIAVNNIDKQASEQRKATREKEAAEEKAEAEKLKAEAEAAAKEKAEALQRIRDAEANTLEERRALERIKLKEEYDGLIAEATKYGLDSVELKLSYEQRLAEMDAQFKQEDLDREQQLADEKKAILEKETADRLAAKEAQVAIENAKWGLLAQAAGLAKELAGENEAIQIAAVVAQQAAAIGQIVANTGIANAKAVAASPLTFGQPWVAINTISAGLSIATAVAQGVKAVKDIKAARNGSSPSASAPAGIAGNRGASATTASRTPLGNVETQAPQSIQTAPTVQAYVIAGTVTSAQEADAKISRKRTIG